MAVFTYTATTETRSRVRGSIAADSPRQARELLRARGLRVSQIAGGVQEQARKKSGWSRIKASQVASLIRELATLLGAGTPLLESLEILCQQYQGRVRTSLVLLRDRISAGIGLAEAMAEQPGVYDELCIHMVGVGENAGNLEGVLNQLADFKDRSAELKDRVITALLYPTVVFVTSLLVALFLMTVVVPMLLDNLIDAGRTLPWPTRVLKAISDALLGYGWLLGILAVGLGVGAAAVQRTTAGQRASQRLLLKIPLLGTMAQKQTIARIALVMMTLMKSGIVYLRALEIAAQSTRNLIIRESLLQSGQCVGAGQEIGAALSATGVFPPLVVHIFSVGQKSGQLEEMLERLATTYDRQVTTMSGRLAAALEPILILTLAIFVGFILFATLLPILEAGNVL
jgi:general secretion pathway protein F